MGVDKMPALQYSITPSFHSAYSVDELFSSSTGKIFDEAAFFQFGDEARVHERLGFLIPDLGPLRRDVFVGRLQSLRDRVGNGDEVFAVNLVGAFEQFSIVGF